MQDETSSGVYYDDPDIQFPTPKQIAYAKAIQKALSIPRPYRAGVEARIRRIWRSMSDVEQREIRGY